jgi:hypothetical protein
MGSPRNLLIPALCIAGVVSVLAAAPAGAAQSECGGTRLAVGGCGPIVHGGISSGGIVVDGEIRRGGSGPVGGTYPAADTHHGGSGNARPLIGGRVIGDFCSPILGCGALEQLPDATADPSEQGEPAVTIRDVASFAPEAPADVMEPGRGIAVRRLAANFISQATAQVVEGTLLGRPAAVRFTPVGFSWTTGDGGRVDSPTAGASWKALRQKELTDTATSHRYAERGWFDVQPTVTYAAEYRFDGSGWIPIDGTLDIAGQAYRVRVVTVETRLTRGDCIQFPQDPGCE